MSDDLSHPLLALVKAQDLIDDLQYEEVLGEHKRTAKPIIQILQDFGVMDLDAILQTISNHLGAPVVTLRERDLTPELLRLIPAKTAHMYQCLPVALDVKAGDRILFGKWSGTEVKIDGDEFLIMKESDIMGIIET